MYLWIDRSSMLSLVVRPTYNEIIPGIFKFLTFSDSSAAYFIPIHVCRRS